VVEVRAQVACRGLIQNALSHLPVSCYEPVKAPHFTR
jgi:hypothetical protein